ncbi:hypothetical protein H6P81_010397 [Aristolochia fimbriata]|uniref:Ribosomal protein L29 n=1 Tax=Aristolochia fimbriata TaxID=158543 RepID=A0AAV7ES18_ARIFI|nr:hypothetical protein H6P81_010397 [Aristolochia fimbriata]
MKFYLYWFWILGAAVSTGRRIKVHELRTKSKTDKLDQLKELKAELALLLVAKVTGGAPNKLSEMSISFRSSFLQR